MPPSEAVFWPKRRGNNPSPIEEASPKHLVCHYCCCCFCSSSLHIVVVDVEKGSHNEARRKKVTAPSLFVIVWKPYNHPHLLFPILSYPLFLLCFFMLSKHHMGWACFAKQERNCPHYFLLCFSSTPQQNTHLMLLISSLPRLLLCILCQTEERRPRAVGVALDAMLVDDSFLLPFILFCSIKPMTGDPFPSPSLVLMG